MEIGKTRLALSASMLALALVLAGCGGGGSGSTAVAPTDTSNTDGTDTGGTDTGMNGDDDDDMPMMNDQEKLAAAYTELMAARAAVAALKDDASDEDRSAALLRESKAEMAYAEAWALDGNESDRAAAKLRAEGISGTLLTDNERTDDAFTVMGGELTPAAGTDEAVKFTEDSPRVWVRTLADKSRQWVVPRTDKAADEGAKFSEYYGSSSAPQGSVSVGDDAGFTWKAWAEGVSSDGSVITIAGDSATSDTFKLFDFNFAMDEDDGDGMKFAGSFHGIPGDLACASVCIAPAFDANNMITSIGGTWTFTPTATGDDLAGLPVADVKADAEYLDFGTWGTIVDTDDGQTRKYGAYAQASRRDNALTSLEGKAEYKGMAYGAYAKKMAPPGGGDLVPTTHGGFSAMAMLTAEFGTRSSVPQDDHNRIWGTISDFRDGGSPIDSSWMVTLERADIGENGIIGTEMQGVTKTTGDAGSMTPGKWGGEFLGGSGSATPAVMPSAVTGSFDAHFTNGHVVGAFGAYEQKPAE